MSGFCDHSKSRTVYSGLDKVYRTRHYGIDKALSVKKCLGCGVVFTDPKLEYSDLKQYFSEEYGSFQVRIRRENLLGRLRNFIKESVLAQFFGYGEPKWWGFLFYPFRIPLAHFPKKMPGGRLLDVGCGSGNYLEEVKKLDWEVYGLDPSPVAVEVARKRGLTGIKKGDLSSADWPDSFFDVVTMFHVFEHVPDPHKALTEVKKILKPGGLLIIGVPNFSSLGSKIYGKYWAGLSFPLHYFHYQRNTLNRVLRDHQFKLADCHYANLFSDIFVSSPESALSPRYDYKLPRLWQKIFSIGNMAWGTIDYLIGNLIANAFGFGSQITVAAVNKK